MCILLIAWTHDALAAVVVVDSFIANQRNMLELSANRSGPVATAS